MSPPTAHKNVQVAKALHGKVIGTHGATLRDIESDYPGVKVVVPRRDDPSDLIQISGPADAVSRAEKRVMDISGQLGDAAAKERRKADVLRKEKDELFDEAHRTNDRAKKRRLLDEAHAKKRELEAEEQAAAKRIFHAKNSGYGLEQMDLHGLHVDEAVERVEERLRRLEAGEVASVEIITGAGHHSEAHRAKIRPAVEAALQKHPRLAYTLMSANGGFVVSLAEGATPTGGAATAPDCGGLVGRFMSWLASKLGCLGAGRR